MKLIADRREMQAIDSYSIQKIGIPGMVLMEKASMALFDEVIKRINHHSRCLIVVEKGNNGGDGLALARLLREAGYSVMVYEIGGILKASDSYLAQRGILKELEIPVAGKLPEEEFDVIVDGIFGVGLTREVRGIQKNVIEQLNQKNAYRIAIDVPSGVDASTGNVLGTAFQADLTVTFGLLKTGLLLYPGAAFAGEVVVKEIGFPKKAIEAVDPKAFTYEVGDEALIPSRRADSNKGTYKRVLVVAGGKNMAGAAYFSAKAAYRSGCGLVRLFTREENRQILQTLIPEAVMTTFETEEEGCETLKEAVSWADVLVFGPGMGCGQTTRRFLRIIKECTKVPVIIDADGLNEIGQMRAEGEDFLKDFPAPLVLTPHMLEMCRLTGIQMKELKENRIAIAQQFAGQFGLTLVLKDARTIVTKGEGILYINQTGNNGMATGGSGDVLTGIIAGMAAAGMDVIEAAAMGVFLHGRCGDEAAAEKGKRSLMAGDLSEYLSCVF